MSDAQDSRTQTGAFSEGDRHRVQTFLRMMKSDQPGERDEASRQLARVLDKYNLLEPLAEHPEWLSGAGGAMLDEIGRAHV